MRENALKDLNQAQTFCNLFQVINILAAINYDGKFRKAYREIYPPKLELKRENSIRSSD